MARIILAVDIIAPAEEVFEAMVDWPSQRLWIPSTTVEVVSGNGRDVGSQLAAYSGVGPLGFTDTMTITRWDAPHRVDVMHTGSVVRGPGLMRVIPLSDLRSRFYWGEDLVTPAGRFGEAGWQVVKPALRAGFGQALRRFAELVEG